jgi:hypothetical protein
MGVKLEVCLRVGCCGQCLVLRGTVSGAAVFQTCRFSVAHHPARLGTAPAVAGCDAQVMAGVRRHQCLAERRVRCDAPVPTRVPEVPVLPGQGGSSPGRTETRLLCQHRTTGSRISGTLCPNSCPKAIILTHYMWVVTVYTTLITLHVAQRLL